MITKIDAESLNHVIQEGEDKGYSSAFGLCFSEQGHKILLNNPDLIKKIDAESLNHVIKSGWHKGYSAVLWLCSTPKGLEILFKNPGLLKIINTESLNSTAIDGIHKGASAVLNLCSTMNGMDLLLNKEGLYKKINMESLKQIIAKWEGRGLSGRLLKLKDRDILKKEKKLLTAIVQFNNFFKSAKKLETGCNTIPGLKDCLIKAHHEIFRKTEDNRSGFKLVSDDLLRSIYDKQSLFYQILNTSSGVFGVKSKTDELVNAAKLELAVRQEKYDESMISLKTVDLDAKDFINQLNSGMIDVNHIISKGPYLGLSVTFWLCNNWPGLKILSTHQHLIRKINTESLNHVIQAGEHKGLSAAIRLCCTGKGLEMLLEHTDLVEKINIKSLNYVINAGEHEGHSAAFWLCCTRKGREVLLNNYDLIEKINAESLNLIIEQGKWKDQSAAFWLCSSHEGGGLLGANTKLVEKLNETTLLHVIKEGMFEGQCAFSSLCMTDDGKELLRKIPSITSRINSEHIKKLSPKHRKAVTDYLAQIQRKESQLRENHDSAVNDNIDYFSEARVVKYDSKAGNFTGKVEIIYSTEIVKTLEESYNAYVAIGKSGKKELKCRDDNIEPAAPTGSGAEFFKDHQECERPPHSNKKVTRCHDGNIGPAEATDSDPKFFKDFEKHENKKEKPNTSGARTSPEKKEQLDFDGFVESMPEAPTHEVTIRSLEMSTF